MKKFLTLLLTVVMVMPPLSGCIKQSTVQAPSQSGNTDTAAPASSSGNKDKQLITIRIGVGGPTTLPVCVAINEILVDEFSKKSDGHIKFELYAGSQLGDDVKAIEAVRTGTLEMTSCVTAPVVGLVKEYSVFDTPFLFNDSKMAFSILDGPVGSKIADLTAAKGIYVLGWSELGFRHLTNSVRDVRKPEDIKGLKIRTMENPIHLATWKALGANPTPMPVSEVFTAIQQHAIDGQENPISAFFGWKIHEVNKHITLTGHVYSPQVFLFSKKIFDTYSKEDQDIIKEYVDRAAKRAREVTKQQEEDFIKQMKAANCNIIELTPDEKAVFQKATEPIWKTVSDTVGADLMNMLQSELKKVK